MQTLKLKKKYEKYPEYKDSGVEWLGNIPKDWEKNKLKRLFSFQSGDGFPDNLQGGQTGDVPFLKVSDINGVDQYISSSNNYVDFKMVKEKSWHLIPSGSILMPKIGAALSKNHRKVNTVPVCIDNNMLAVTPQNIVKEFGYWIWKMLNMSDFENISSVPSVNLNQLRNHSLAIPEMSEQKNIAKYLDEKTSYIDRIIENKQRLIELLKEKRTAVINNAVTKGLNSKAELVESGIDWIGKIPKGWEIKKLKSGFDFEKGKEAGKFTQEFVTNEKNRGEYPVYSGQTENDGILGKINTYKYNFPEGVLFSTTVGAKAMTTKFLVGKFSLSQNCVLMIPNKKANSAYFNYLLEIGFKRMRDNIPSHMQPSLRVSDLNKFTVLFPTVDEQKNIAEYLDEKTKFFDAAINTTDKTIELLQELKSSLISNVVTGKIKV